MPHRDRRTKGKKYRELDDDLTYTANQLDRDVVAENQIRLVIRTFKDRLFTEIFPGRTEVPKTLVFAKTISTPKTSCASSARSSARETTSARRSPPKRTGKKPDELLVRVPQLATTLASPSPWT